ncbi:MAG: imidazoleglycerol-phosphate dehydratase HisB [Deferribacteraceae bacterium]|jgi:imidazoleglycerol-phosphate dehydratase|nr:imidazoleglycerol-phosphate dehydratase HisB [Deferribacteraceae bacterium]
MRVSKISRTTKETQIDLELNLDGGDIDISTGVGFLDHMLTLFAHHGGMGLVIKATGDTHIDDHHTVEDIGISLGKAIYEALGDKKGIVRYGQMLLPMDETLIESVVDISGRSYLVFNAEFRSGKVGTFDTALVEEFFVAFTSNAKITLHINMRYGRNDHHIAEGIFKGVARAMRVAMRVESDSVNSTKGMIE